MTGNWIWIPFTALGCYLYLLLSLLAAKKNRAIYSFMILLCAMTLWTEGSLMMRLLSWPGYKFWYDISIFGLLFMLYSFYYCVGVLLGIERPPHLRIWFTVLLGAGILNSAFGCFVPAPNVQQTPDGKSLFIYDMPAAVMLLFAVGFVIIADTIRMYRLSDSDQREKRQLRPLFVGYGAMVLGHLAICIPAFAGIPLDILSGVINAICIFQAFRRKRLVRLTLLVSRNNCYLFATGLTMFALLNWFNYIEKILLDIFPGVGEQAALLISALSVITTLAIYETARFVIDRIFVRDETMRTERLKEFCFQVSQTLHEDEILKYVFRIILNNTPTERIYACMLREKGYKVYDSATGLCSETESFSGELIAYLQENPECIAVKELEYMSFYQNVKEEERQALRERKIGCIVPLGNDQFAGFLALCSKNSKVKFSYEEVAFLESAESVASMALKNAELYEKARIEARTDVMTGLLNRRAFYELLNERCCEPEENFSLLLINLDDFKLFNQLYGVTSGDQAIRTIGILLADTAGKHGEAARYGGKEFAVILPGKTAEDTEEVARELLAEMNKIKAGTQELNLLTASCGICSFPDMADTSEELLAYAELAVYHVKQHGKNNVFIYREGGIPSDEKEKEEIYSSYAATIYALTAAIDTKDHYTFNHSQNVAYYATGLARLLGKNEDFIEVIREAALLHDIGKIGIPEDILNKPGKLTEEEYHMMQMHVENSIGIIRHLPSLNYVIPAVICHHERYDGKGYPRRIAGKDIPLSGRILGIADSFDAMVSRRSYKEPYPLEKAVSIIIEEKGAQFDPELSDIFIEGIRAGKIAVQ